MTMALLKEIVMQKDYLQEELVETVYFGGGTPSLLSKQELHKILQSLKSNFEIAEQVEITLEANPDDLDINFLNGLLSLGINRLSLGVQTFNDEALTWMNRAHRREQAMKCFQMARSAGFDNISMDLIFGVPIESYELADDLEITLDLTPDHVSTYQLTIEPQTVLGHRQRKGLLQEISQEQAAAQFELIISTLEQKGYQHYEISNFALHGKESRHNRGYWQQSVYLGLGPSAHSFNGYSRQFNVAHNAQYLAALQQGVLPHKLEILTRSNQINESIMTGLRTSGGLDLGYLQEHYQCDLQREQGSYLQELITNKFAEIDENKIILTRKGKLIADQIAADLFIVDD